MESRSESPSERIERLRKFTLVMLELYRAAALAQIDEAEVLVAKALELRESALGMLSRANSLAYTYAVAKDDEELYEGPAPF